MCLGPSFQLLVSLLLCGFVQWFLYPIQAGAINGNIYHQSPTKKAHGIEQHLQKNISQAYNNLDVSFQSFPADNQVDPNAYKTAIDALPAGSAITIVTPDTTHYPIALYAIQRKIHVLITKPATKLLTDHLHLLDESRKYGVFVFVEHHKRFDPAYSDARAKARTLGDFNYFYSYMSQPKSQLETFKAWAGRDSDISYYLNSHHVDICESMVPDYVPVKVTAMASKGTAVELGCVPETEDTITLLVEWRKKGEPNKIATGVYTASWTAPQKAGVHSNQYFHCMYGSGWRNLSSHPSYFAFVPCPYAHAFRVGKLLLLVRWV